MADCRVSSLLTANQFSVAEASSVWIRAQLEDLYSCCKKYCLLSTHQYPKEHVIYSYVDNIFLKCSQLIIFANLQMVFEQHVNKLDFVAVQVSLLGKDRKGLHSPALLQNADEQQTTHDKI